MCSVVPPKRDVFWFKTPMNTSSIYWLVVLTILKNMSSSMGRIIPYILEERFETTEQIMSYHL